MKQRKLMAILMVLFFACSVFQNATVNVFAEGAGAEKVREDRSGVLTVYAGVKESGSNEAVPLSIGSGFLIGSLDSGQYIITNNHVVDIESAKAEYADKTKKNVKNLKTVIQVVVASSDVTVDATLVKNSVQNDIAILKLEEKVYNCNHLVLSDDANVAETQMVYALGFPYDVTYYGNDVPKLKNEDVAIEFGNVSKFVTKGGIKCILHDAQLSKGSSGGPLVDEEGNVIGVNAYSLKDENDQDYYYSIRINIVKEILDTLGVQYDKVGEEQAGDAIAVGEETATDVQEEATEAPVVDKSGLQSAIEAAKTKNADDYTEESYADLTEKLNAANEVMNNEEVNQTEVDDAKAALTMATDQLEEKSGFPIAIVIVAVVVVLIIIIAVVLISGKKKKNKKQPITPPTPQPVPQPTPQPSPIVTPPTPTPSPAPFYGEGAGETSVLNEGAGETTLLSNQSMVQATLFRESNCENIKINKGIFSIGKERKKVDYCISDNNSISRNHAQINVKGGKFYIIDQKSTNGTYLNEVKLNPLQEMELKNGDKIRLSDEEFIFKML